MPDQTMYNWRRLLNKPLTDPYLCQPCESAQKQAKKDAETTRKSAKKAEREERRQREQRRQLGRTRTVFGSNPSPDVSIPPVGASFEICVVCGARVYQDKYDWCPGKICKPCRGDIREERTPPPVAPTQFRKSPEWSTMAADLLPTMIDCSGASLPLVSGVLTQMENTSEGNEVWVIRCEEDSDRTMGAFRSRDKAMAAAARNNIQITSVEEYREWWRR